MSENEHVKNSKTTSSYHSKNSILIYTDGACSGNPGPGGWASIIYLNNFVYEIADRQTNTTNNQMELLAAIKALQFVLENISNNKINEIYLYTDSVYVIKGITQWIHGWKKNDFINQQNEPVANKNLWLELDNLVLKVQKVLQLKINWLYVRGHVGVDGNERCDEVAVAFSKNEYIDLNFQVPANEYLFDILKTPKTEALPDFKKQNSNTSKNSWYLVYHAGVLSKYLTWKECESKVKGVPGVKFKKVSSHDEEQALLKQWGVLVRNQS